MPVGLRLGFDLTCAEGLQQRVHTGELLFKDACAQAIAGL